MNDPYKVLGVSPSATDEQIKDAYRQLARKYHPDNYVNNPLSDLATEKMKEINEAYDAITKQRSGGGGYQQQPTQPVPPVPQNTQPYGTSQLFGNQPQQPYTPAFNSNAPQGVPQADPMQQTGQIPPQPSAMEQDQRGIPAFLRRKK